jgi:aspartyl-tRNA synthetase
MKIYIKDTLEHVGESVVIVGWINSARDHGKVVFLDIRDSSGLIQTVLIDNMLLEHSRLAPETLVKITGLVKKRP